MSHESLLHAARMRSGRSLDEIVASTRLSPRVARALDEGRFNELPAGLYARAYLRAFASAVDADIAVIEEQLAPLLPALGDDVQTVRAIADQAEAAGRSHPQVATVLLAATVDALLLCAMNASLLGLVAASASIPTHLLAGQAMGAAGLGAVTMFTYFILFAGIEGRTPGRALCGLGRLGAAGPLSARDVLTRAARIALEEMSLVLTWLRHSRRPV